MGPVTKFRAPGPPAGLATPPFCPPFTRAGNVLCEAAVVQGKRPLAPPMKKIKKYYATVLQGVKQMETTFVRHCIV